MINPIKKIKEIDERFEKRRLETITLEPSTVHFPQMVKCPYLNCSERGKYTFCYLGKDFKKCENYGG